MNSFISWVGGKKALRDEILRRFPVFYERYIEVFGGGGWVLFHKPPERFEVWNDFNSNLVTLYRCVREQPEALKNELRYVLNSREDFSRITALFKNQEAMTDVQRAANFYQLIKYSYASGLTSFGSQPFDMWSTFPAIDAAHNRLRDVIIENKDFEALIRQYDREGAFFYLDPPYFGTEDYYLDVGFTKENHQRLFNILCSLQGRFLLSYNDDPFIRELYKDYHIVEVTRINNIKQRYDGGAEYPELLIANYDMSERSRQHEQISLMDYAN